MNPARTSLESLDRRPGIREQAEVKQTSRALRGSGDFQRQKRLTQIVNRVVPSICSVRSIIAREWWPSDRVRHHILSPCLEEVIKCGS